MICNTTSIFTFFDHKGARNHVKAFIIKIQQVITGERVIAISKYIKKKERQQVSKGNEAEYNA